VEGEGEGVERMSGLVEMGVGGFMVDGAGKGREERGKQRKGSLGDGEDVGVRN